jgi:DNA repair exonuclease SbcCD ATPase subunit
MTNNSTTPIQLLLSHIDDLQKELKASKANIEMMNMVKQYWANLCADLRRSSVSDYVRLEKRAEKAEAEVERLTKLTEDCLNVIRVYCPTYYQDAMERFNKTNK